jgi:hypothetical protein
MLRAQPAHYLPDALPLVLHQGEYSVSREGNASAEKCEESCYTLPLFQQRLCMSVTRRQGVRGGDALGQPPNTSLNPMSFSSY